jgi:uncharacterized damage-inducible protein DinB
MTEPPELREVSGIGAALAAELRAVGVPDVGALRELGVTEVARRLADLGLRDPERTRRRLAAALDALDPAARAGPTAPPVDQPPSWDEPATLATALDHARASVRATCRGVSDTDARRAPLPTSPLMTMSGVVSHLRWVEYDWIQVIYLGDDDHAPWTDDDPDREFRIATATPIEQLLDDYDTQSADYRRLVAARDLNSFSARPRRLTGEPVTLRWIVLHLIDEIARHNGHLDVLRELADGVRGNEP